MIGLIQRVKWAKVEVDNQTVGEISTGLLVLLGVEQGDDLGKNRSSLSEIFNLFRSLNFRHSAYQSLCPVF